MNRVNITVTVLVVVLGLWVQSSCKQDNGVVNTQASQNSSGAENTFSYGAYEEVLVSFVDEDGMVDYAALKEQRDRLDEFVSNLAEIAPGLYQTWSSREQLSLWINAYNALTLQVIIDHYPIQAGFFRSLVYPENSIRQIPGVWDELKFSVLGRSLTLDEIEHEIIRKEFQEPRIHMALVCAARGCPPLRNEAYRGEMLDSQLTDQTHRFLSDPDKFRIDYGADTVYLSSIFDWFQQDFLDQYEPESGFSGEGGAEPAVLNFVSLYLPSREADYLRRGRYEIEYLDYDWSLNEQ